MGNDKMPPSVGPVIAVAFAQGGLTLIELIVAIVILGILSVGATALIVRSVQTYQTNRAAGELASQGEMALTVMTRELHNAQPGTLNIPNGGARARSFRKCAESAAGIDRQHLRRRPVGRALGQLPVAKGKAIATETGARSGGTGWRNAACEREARPTIRDV